MSTLEVNVTQIKAVAPHPNADRLSIVECDGWSCITSKDRFKPGDTCIYIPIDAVLPEALLNRIFGADAKVRPAGGRIKTIKLRGVVSQGLVIAPDEVADLLPADYKQGADVTTALGITKYTRKVKGPSTTLSSKVRSPKPRRILAEQFVRYTDISHGQKHGFYLDQLATEGMEVVAHVKVHGTSARYGWVQRSGWWDKVRKALGLSPRWVFLIGSRNVDMEAGEASIVVHSSLPRNVYQQAYQDYNMQWRVPVGYVVYGEIIGPGVQPGYDYGVPPGQVRFLVYDVRKGDRWLSDTEIGLFCKDRDFQRVVECYRGPYSAELMKVLASGPDPIAPKDHPPREGIVVRPVVERSMHGQRLIFKFVSPEFLLSKHSDEETPDEFEQEQPNAS